MAHAKIRNLRVLLVFGAVLVVVSGFAIWSRFHVDPVALVDAHDSRILADIFAGKEMDVRAIQKSLAHFHKGPRPCATYDEVEIPADEIADIERELRGAGLLGRIRDTSPLFWRWGNADERRRHGTVTDDEILAYWSLTGTLYERAVAVFDGHAIAEASRAKTKKMERAETERADAIVLTHHEEEALEGLWMRHPIALGFPGFVKTMGKLPRE